MSKYPLTPETCIAKFIEDLSKELLTAKTVSTYGATIRIVVKHLTEDGRNALPYKITEEDVKWLVGTRWAHLAISTRKDYRAALSRFTIHFDNPIVKKVKVRFPHDMRPNIRRLTNKQASDLWKYPMTPMQRLVIMLELYMGLRRTEVLRLTTRSIHRGSIIVSGKGGIGGKPRLVPFHRDTSAAVINDYMLARSDLIKNVRKRRPDAEDPEQLIIYKRGNYLHPYTEDGLDRAVSEKLSKQLGFKFSNHDLRRTFARRHFEIGTPKRDIANMLGHETEAETEKYIGIFYDNLVNAQENFSYEEGV